MDNNQARIIELLREVHLIAFKEIERLNLRHVFRTKDLFTVRMIHFGFSTGQ
jgi:hypothetical protein